MTDGPRVVLDASFLLHEVSSDDRPEGEAVRRALPALKERFAPIAPQILVWEVGQFLHVKYPDAFPGGADDRAETMHLVMEGIDLHEVDSPWVVATGRLAETHRITYYDASYLATAKTYRDSVLLTDDRRLRKAGQGELGKNRVAGSHDFLEVLKVASD